MNLYKTLMTDIVLAADLGGTNLRIAAVGRDGTILERSKIATPRDSKPDRLFSALVEIANDCLKKCEKVNLTAIAIAVPATVDACKGILLDAPNLPELNGFGIVSALEEEMNVKVFLENDANAAAIGESWLGATKNFEDSIMVTLGTGVGGGIIIDGKILRGPDGTAGEIGHINVEPCGHPCGCGSHGCLEQYSSATAVVRMANELAAENPDSKLAGVDKLTSKHVYQLGLESDEDALAVFKKQGFYLGLALSGLINSLNPEAIVFGGGAAAAWDLFMPELLEQIGKRTYLTPAERVKLFRSELGDDAGILGAAHLGFENVDHN
ncbi:MAG: ROK family protein [Pyrinomonadaceae bacterium]|nr:ROK family protein [Pyrinomonadaceae bacterium]